MACSISRMQFLRGDFRGHGTPIRPPWAIPEQAFVEVCDACGDCIRVCPTRILKAGRGRFPQVDFAQGVCTFCGDCVKVCKPQALSFAAHAGQSPWQVKAQFEDHCLSVKGVTCYTCQEACDRRAIRIRPALGGRARPELDVAACNGCGQCYAPCPVQAVRLAAQVA